MFDAILGSKHPGIGVYLRAARVALSPPSVVLRSRLRNGAIVEGPNRPGHGGRGVYLFGELLEPELFHLQDLLRPGDVFFDVGANVGVFTIKAAREVGAEGTVVAIEPSVETAHQLQENVRLNGFKNVRVRVLAAGSITSTDTFYLNCAKPNSYSLLRVGDPESVSVLKVSLDDLCRWEQIDRLDYIKIDAEGAEAEVLAGAAESIRTYRPVIQVETTICPSAFPSGYQQFVIAGSPNALFIPEESRRICAMVTSLGWSDVSAQAPAEFLEAQA